MCKIDYIPSWLSDAKTILEKLNKCIAYIELNKVVANPDEDADAFLEKIKIGSNSFKVGKPLGKPLFLHWIVLSKDTTTINFRFLSYREEQYTVEEVINILPSFINGTVQDGEEFGVVERLLFDNEIYYRNAFGSFRSVAITSDLSCNDTVYHL